MSELDLIKSKIVDTEAKLKKAEAKLEQLEGSEVKNELEIKKWEGRTERLAALLIAQQNLLIAQQNKENLILANQGAGASAELPNYALQLTALRDAIVGGTVTEREDVLVVEGVSFPVAEDAKAIFVRDFYELFYIHFRDNVVNAKGVAGIIYHGPPGVGKSHFAMYYLYKLLRDGTTVVYENVYNDLVYVIPASGACRVYGGKASGLRLPELHDPTVVHLFDACAGTNAREPHGHKAKLAIFTSPNGCSFKQFLRSEALMLTVPSYTHAEMDKRRPWFPEVKDESYEEKIRVCGCGSIRLVLGTSQEWAVEMVGHAINSLTVQDLLNIVQRVEGIPGSGRQGPHTLFATSLHPGADKTSIESYRPSKMSWNVASSFIMQKFIDKHKDEATLFAQRAAAVFQSTPGLEVTAGMFFEQVAPLVLAKGGTFRVRQLTSDGAVEEDVLWPEMSDNRPVGVTQPSQVHERCKDINALYSILKTLAGIDSFKPPNQYFNFTTREDHPINMSAAVTICSHAQSKSDKAAQSKSDKAELYFVVPPHRFESGWTKPQSFSAPKGQCNMAKLLEPGDQEARRKLEVTMEQVDVVNRHLVQYALSMDFKDQFPVTTRKTNKSVGKRDAKVKKPRGGRGAGGEQVRRFSTCTGHYPRPSGVTGRAMFGVLKFFL